jgi:hypothetical protein
MHILIKKTYYGALEEMESWVIALPAKHGNDMGTIFVFPVHKFERVWVSNTEFEFNQFEFSMSKLGRVPVMLKDTISVVMPTPRPPSKPPLLTPLCHIKS